MTFLIPGFVSTMTTIVYFEYDAKTFIVKSNLN